MLERGVIDVWAHQLPLVRQKYFFLLTWGQFLKSPFPECGRAAVAGVVSRENFTHHYHNSTFSLCWDLGLYSFAD